jgi:hypothetical protein
MKASSVLGGNFIKSDDLKESGPQRFLIEEVGVAEFDSKKKPGAKEKKLELTVDEGKTITLNSTSTRVLIAAYGNDTDKWVGKPVIAFFDPDVMFGPKKVGGLRVKVPSSAASAASSLEA